LHQYDSVLKSLLTGSQNSFFKRLTGATGASQHYVLYVGSERLSMPSELVTPCLTCRFKIIDIRNWEAETLLQGKYPADAVLAILGRHSDRPETIRGILQRILK
jgi:hypothetical protein